MKAENKEECVFILWTIAYILSFVFIFSSIGVISGLDHIVNGLTTEGMEIFEYSLITSIVILLFLIIVSIYTQDRMYIAWAHISSLLFSTSVICYIISQCGIDCGRCSRLYLKDVPGVLNDSVLEYTKCVSFIIMISSTIYTFIVILKNKSEGYGYTDLYVCDILCESLCETIYYLLSVFLPLFMCVICMLTGGDSSGIDCSSGNESSNEFKGTNNPHGLKQDDIV